MSCTSHLDRASKAELPEESCTCDFRLPFEFRSTCRASRRLSVVTGEIMESMKFKYDIF
jgi:hypothetical protein